MKNTAPSEILYKDKPDNIKGIKLKLSELKNNKAIYIDISGNEYVLSKYKILDINEKSMHRNDKYFLDLKTLQLSSMNYITNEFLEKYTKIEAAIDKCRFRRSPTTLEVEITRKKN